MIGAEKLKTARSFEKINVPKKSHCILIDEELIYPAGMQNKAQVWHVFLLLISFSQTVGMNLIYSYMYISDHSWFIEIKYVMKVPYNEVNN